MAYRIFISHVWRAQNSYYQGLIRLLDRAKYFGFTDLSVPRIRSIDGQPEPAKDQILELLRTADVVLVINTPVVSRSDFVKIELAEAEKYDIPIIAISPPARLGAMNGSQHPAVLRARKAPWRSDSIVNAIREETRLKRRLNAAASNVEASYEPVAEAAVEEPLTPTELAEVRGDDEIVDASHQTPQGELPKDVLLGGPKDHLATAQPNRSWLSKLFPRH